MEAIKLISSQEYINDSIVNQKIVAGDFEVQVTPEFEIDGEKVRAIVDGHHSYQAAKIARVDPILIEQDESDNDRIALLDEDIDLFLEAAHHDTDWYYIDTGITCF